MRVELATLFAVLVAIAPVTDLALVKNDARGYTNAQLVGDQLMPFVYADKEAGKIPLFGKDHFRAYATERALRAKSNRINPADIGSVDVSMDEHDLEYPIDYREDAESSFPLQASATNAVLHGIQLRHELMVAALIETYDLERSNHQP